jgi:hypothetical protein
VLVDDKSIEFVDEQVDLELRSNLIMLLREYLLFDLHFSELMGSGEDQNGANYDNPRLALVRGALKSLQKQYVDG